MPRVFIALGGNRPGTAQAFTKALAACASFLAVKKKSPVYKSKAQYWRRQPDFLNMVIAGETSLPAMPLLMRLKRIEREGGRRGTYPRYGPRLIDLDILYYHRLQFRSKALTIPHPKRAERLFVLRPLCDIAPHWRDPVRRSSVKTLCRSRNLQKSTCLRV